MTKKLWYNNKYNNYEMTDDHSFKTEKLKDIIRNDLKETVLELGYK